MNIRYTPERQAESNRRAREVWAPEQERSNAYDRAYMRDRKARLICELPPEPVGQQCAACGCTDNDCRNCIGRTGQPCHWIAINLCSACEYVLEEASLAHEAECKAAAMAVLEEAT